MLLLFLWQISAVVGFGGEVALKNLGEKEYLLIKAKSSVPKHGVCWHDALRTINSSCANLNDEEHSILALKLSNCFLEESGHSIYDCHLNKLESERRECINRMSDRAFNVYNEFYTHTINMCFFLNHEIWQSETRDVIKRLYHVSSLMKDQLTEASEMQAEMLESQREGLKVQNELLIHGRELESVLRSSYDTVNDMVTEFKQTAKDQKELLYEIFSYTRTFQNWIIGEVSWFQSIIYYSIGCVICALFSSSKRTRDARTALFTILSFNIVAERMLVPYYDNVEHPSSNDKVQLAEIIWFLRKISLGLCVTMLFCTYYYYKDEHVENYKALRRIEKQLNVIQRGTLDCTKERKIRYSERLALKRLEVTVNQDNADDRVNFE